VYFVYDLHVNNNNNYGGPKMNPKELPPKTLILFYACKLVSLPNFGQIGEYLVTQAGPIFHYRYVELPC